MNDKGGICIDAFEKCYSVYLHTNIHNNKRYYGITKHNACERWKMGIGYQDNDVFFADIQKYGWEEGFSHEIIAHDLTYLEARNLENELIKQYQTVENGYNKSYSTVSNLINFDFFDFTVFNLTSDEYVNDVDYFTRIPNMFIQTNLKKQFGLHRIFYIVWIMIDRNRNYEDVSYISIGNILTMCKYKVLPKRKPKVFYEVIKCLFFLRENNYIECSIDPFSISFKDAIQIKIIKKNFDSEYNFTKLEGKCFDEIMSMNTSVSTEILLTIYLYIKSYIINRKPSDQENNSGNISSQNRPEAFWRSIDSMAKELAMSKDTINQCVYYLSHGDEFNEPLLIKHDVGSVLDKKNNIPKNVPNIYVLNQEGYEKEIEWAIQKMLEVYQVDEFFPHKSGNYRFE